MEYKLVPLKYNSRQFKLIIQDLWLVGDKEYLLFSSLFEPSN